MEVLKYSPLHHLFIGESPNGVPQELATRGGEVMTTSGVFGTGNNDPGRILCYPALSIDLPAAFGS